MITHKGIYYFPTAEVAESWAKVHDWPTDRIISYQIGWAIQAGVSGNYAGPGVMPTEWKGN